MLRTDYEGIEEFREKIKKAQGEEIRKLCVERQQMWLDKITDFIFSLPKTDVPFLINTFEMLKNTLEEANPDAKEAAKEIISGTAWEVQNKMIDKDMTEAAARTYAKVIFKK